MPVIQSYQETRGTLPDAPASTDVNPERFGRDAAALQQLGGAIGDFGSKLMQVRKRAEEADAISERRSQTSEWKANEETNLRLQFQKKDENGNPVIGPDGAAMYDVQGFSTELKSRLDKRMQEDLESMPTGDAQRSYQAAVQPEFDRTYVGALQWENVTRARNYDKNTAIRVSSKANFLINNPSLDNTREAIDELRDDINNQVGVTKTAEEGQDLYRAGAKTYVDALFRGYAQSPVKAQEGLMILNHIAEFAPKDPATGEFLMSDETGYPDAGTKMGVNEKGQNVVSGGGMKKGIFGSGVDPMIVQQSLSPDDIDRIRQRLLGVVKTEEKFKMSELHAAKANLVSMITSLDPGALNKMSQAQKRDVVIGYDQMAKNKTISQAEADDTAIVVALGESYAMVRNEMWTMAPSKMNEYDKRLEQEYNAQLKILGRDPNTFGYQHKAQYDAMNDRIKKTILDQRKKDPAGYIEAHFAPDARGSIDRLGIPSADRINWRGGKARMLEMGTPPLTGGEASGLISKLKKTQDENPAEAAKIISSIKEHPYGPRIMNQLTGKGGLDDTFKLAFHSRSEEAATSMISNLKKENRDALFKGISPEDRKEFQEHARKEFATTKSAFSAVGSLSKNNTYAEKLKDAIVVEAINVRNNNSTMSIKDAYAQASDTIVNDHYHIEKTFFVPKWIGEVQTNMNYIKGEMQAIHSPDYRKKMGIEVAPKTAVPGETPEQKKSRVASEERSLNLSIEKGRWVTAPSGLKATFMIPKGPKNWQPLYKKDGSPVELDYSKSSLGTSQEAVDYNKPWFEKIMGK